jgi:hypothetical protein
VSSFITDHHELCDGSDCNTWDCASLPGNVGQWREGVVTAVNSDGSVQIEWSDGTTGTLKAKRPIHWEDALLATPEPTPLTDRYGEPISEFDPHASEVIMASGEIIDQDSAALYAEAGVQVVHRDGTWTKYHKDGSVVQHRADDSVYTREN